MEHLPDVTIYQFQQTAWDKLECRFVVQDGEKADAAAQAIQSAVRRCLDGAGCSEVKFQVHCLKSLEQIVHFDLHLKAEKESYSTKLAGDGPVTLGITAGASCPNNLIEDTVLRVFQLRGIDEAAVRAGLA